MILKFVVESDPAVFAREFGGGPPDPGLELLVLVASGPQLAQTLSVRVPGVQDLLPIVAGRILDPEGVDPGLRGPGVDSLGQPPAPQCRRGGGGGGRRFKVPVHESGIQLKNMRKAEIAASFPRIHGEK